MVLIQFTCIAVLIFTTPFKNTDSISASLLATGLLLGFWALLKMQRSRFRFLPEPHHDARLITGGPYRYIRHPMYSAVILITAGMLLIHMTNLRLCAGGFLFLVLHLKIQREEHLLDKQFPAYAGYRDKTWRLFPFLY